MTIHSILNESFPRVPFTRSKGATSRDIDWNLMTEATIAALAWHGLKQKANDPTGKADMSLEDAKAAWEKVIDRHEANELRATRAVDSFERELKKLATSLAAKRAKKENFKITADSYKSEQWKSWVSEYSARADVIALAKKTAEEADGLEL